MSEDQMKPEQELAPPNPPPIPYSIYTPRQKALIVSIVSIAATFSGFASNVYFPSIPTIATDLSVSTELIDLTVTSYLVFQGLSPSIWGAVADVQGRRITYICTFIIFLGSCIGLAQTKHYYQLVILRCMQSAGVASTIAVGAGVLGDITTREERGGYMGFFQAGLLVPVAVGPILGSIFADTLGWRAIFWFLTIASGTFLVILILVLPETLRALVGNGSIPAKSVAESPLAYIQRRRLSITSQAAFEAARPPPPPVVGQELKIDFLGPLRIVLKLDVMFIIIFMSIYYTVWQMTITCVSTLFTRTYGLSQIQVGLTFLGNGVGCILGTLSTGKVLDRNYRRIESQYTGSPESFPLERARLKTIWIFSGMQCVSALVFGWTLEKSVHISVPIICTFFIGWATISIQSVVTTFLIDVFPKKSASATAALNLVRCLMGAGGTAAVLPVINAISVGWAFTLFTGVMLLTLSLIVVQICYGQRWRLRREYREKEVLDS